MQLSQQIQVMKHSLELKIKGKEAANGAIEMALLMKNL